MSNCQENGKGIKRTIAKTQKKKILRKKHIRILRLMKPQRWSEVIMAASIC